MKKHLLLLLFISLCLFSPVTMGTEETQWELVWSDEFNFDGLPDDTKWGYEEGFVRNYEAQFYTKARKENARVVNGMLIVEARMEKYENSKGFTSASLTTNNKASWVYGRFEIRARIPTGRGFWPALWLLGEDRTMGGWPSCGEIDIMENVGFDPAAIHANVHTEKYNHTKKNNKGATIRVKPFPYTDFHIYAIEWFEDRIDFYYDDRKYFTYEDEGTGHAAWPFDKKHYLIMNVAVGGTWGAAQGIDKKMFPQQMCIDYVRIYQKKTVPLTDDTPVTSYPEGTLTPTTIAE